MNQYKNRKPIQDTKAGLPPVLVWSVFQFLDPLKRPFIEKNVSHILSIRNSNWRDEDLPKFDINTLILTLDDMRAPQIREWEKLPPHNQTKRPPTKKHIEEAIPWLQNAIKKGGTILIHCELGVSRSAAFAMLALQLLYPNLSEKRRLAYLREKVSGCARPNRYILKLIDQTLPKQGI